MGVEGDTGTGECGGEVFSFFSRGLSFGERATGERAGCCEAGDGWFSRCTKSAVSCGATGWEVAECHTG